MLYGKSYGFHHALTERSSVAGVDINVSAPEAFWTVIGVAVSLDSSTTMRAGEIFNVALEFFVHWSVLTFLPCASLSNVRFMFVLLSSIVLDIWLARLHQVSGLP